LSASLAAKLAARLCMVWWWFSLLIYPVDLISTRLAKAGLLNERGKRYIPKNVPAMVVY
jgi:hypothetical protein